MPKVTAIVAKLANFTRRLTPRCRSQSRSIGPKVFERSNRALSSGDPRNKKKLVKSTNGTVGTPGTAMPMMASPKEIKAATR